MEIVLEIHEVKVIADTAWQVGGNTWSNIQTITPTIAVKNMGCNLEAGVRGVINIETKK